MIQKLLKNNSGSDLFILTRSVPNQGQYDVPAFLWDQLMEDEDIITYISSGDIIVNNGTSDLNAVDGESFIRRFQEDPDPFSQEGKVYCLTFTRNGSVNNKWLEIGDGCSSDDTWYMIPYTSKLIATTVSNSKAGADFDVRIYKSTFGSGNTKTYNLWDLPNNVRTAVKNNWSGITYSAGTKLGAYIEDNGTNPKDVIFTMWLQITNEDVLDNIENFSGDFSYNGDDDDDD